VGADPAAAARSGADPAAVARSGADPAAVARIAHRCRDAPVDDRRTCGDLPRWDDV